MGSGGRKIARVDRNRPQPGRGVGLSPNSWGAGCFWEKIDAQVGEIYNNFDQFDLLNYIFGR